MLTRCWAPLPVARHLVCRQLHGYGLAGTLGGSLLAQLMDLRIL